MNDFASARWIVLKPRSKVPEPMVNAHGVHDGAALHQVRGIVLEHGFNLGLCLGWRLPNGHRVIAIDEDPRNGGDDTLLALQLDLGDLPLTPCQRTGGGGRQFFLSVPPDVALPSTLGAGVDVKDTGGYVVTPPSVHPNGVRYAWIVKPDATPVAPLPGAYLTRFGAPDRGSFEGSPTGAVGASWLATAFAAAGWLGRPFGGDMIGAVCPHRERHSSGGGDGRSTDTVILAPTDRTPLGSFSCRHTSHGTLRTADAIRLLPFEALRSAMIAIPVLTPYVMSILHPKAA